jgi:hypothetical protein
MIPDPLTLLNPEPIRTRKTVFTNTLFCRFRKEEEEKRRREEEALIGNVYKEFEEHFDDRPTAKLNKTWVKAGTFNAGKKRGRIRIRI